MYTPSEPRAAAVCKCAGSKAAHTLRFARGVHNRHTRRTRATSLCFLPVIPYLQGGFMSATLASTERRRHHARRTHRREAHRLHAPRGPLRPSRRGLYLARPRQARGGQPGRVGQGPCCAGDGGRRRALGSPRPGRHHHRAHERQHRHRARHGCSGARLPARPHDARHHEPRAASPRGGIRGARRAHPRRRRHGRRRGACRGDRRRHAQLDHCGPVRQPREPPRPLRDHRPGDLGGHRGLRGRARCGRRHRRHPLRGGALPQGAEGGPARCCRRARRVPGARRRDCRPPRHPGHRSQLRPGQLRPLRR